ncbi:MAG: formimidoylglutamase [Bacteroidetes bacterium]|nr:formimidoylglutamase [Bacteroidota bacterium]
MLKTDHLKVYNKAYISTLTRKRPGETKLGERVQSLDSNLSELKSSDATFVLLGLSEDIGVRANFGRGGAHTAWQPALTNILNIQSNDFLKGEELLVLGHIEFEDLMKRSERADVSTLRDLTKEVDQRVSDIIKTIILSGKVPIIIGGGHNNSYGNIKGTAEGLFESGKISSPKINVINSDAHTDFRPLEGRHSGNGFSYAFNEGFINKYAVVGLHENYNSQSVLEELKKHPKQIQFSFFEDIFVREELSFKEAVRYATGFTKEGYCGIELDMDTIQNIPSSAKTSSGISANQARQYVTWCAKNTNAVYLHIAEAAPVLSHIKTDNKTGKLIAYLVTDFIKENKLIVKG